MYTLVIEMKTKKIKQIFNIAFTVHGETMMKVGKRSSYFIIFLLISFFYSIQPANAKVDPKCHARMEKRISQARRQLDSDYQNGGKKSKTIWQNTLSELEKMSCPDESKWIKELSGEIAFMARRSKYYSEMSNVRMVCPNLVRDLRMAKKVFAGELKGFQVPSAIENKSPAFIRTMETCEKAVNNLTKLGFTESEHVYWLEMMPHLKAAGFPDPNASLGDIKALMVENRGLEKISQAAKPLNTKTRKNRREAWEKANLKGADQKAVYKEHKYQRPEVKDRGSQIIWTYSTKFSNRTRSDCEDIIFTKDGKTVGSRKYKCY